MKSAAVTKTIDELWQKIIKTADENCNKNNISKTAETVTV
jgi:hypothetical protein